MRRLAAILIALPLAALLVLVAIPAIRGRDGGPAQTEAVTVTLAPPGGGQATSRNAATASLPAGGGASAATSPDTATAKSPARGGARRASRGAAPKVATGPVIALNLAPAASAPAPRDGPQVVVRVNPAETLVSLPRSFFGLSTEYWSLPVYERRTAAFRRLLALLHVPGDGPLTLRIGGTSADHTYWGESAAIRRYHSYVLRQRWLTKLAALTRAEHLRVIIDLNLAADDPGMAARFAGLALKALPARSIAALEIGNEPDLYSTQPYYRLARVARAPVPSPAVWGQYSSTRYAREFRAYARAIALAAPGVKLAGPVLAEPWSSERWIDALLARDRGDVGLLTAHRYPMSDCAPPGTAQYPTIARLLSNGSSTGAAESLEPAIALAERAGLKLDLTELDSVACGGRVGVSNTFATALWAPDTLFSLLQVGVSNVEVHVRNHAINAAFAPRGNRLSARPLLYGLLTFVRTLGVDARLVGCTQRGDSAANFKAWAVRVRGDRLHVLLLDKGARSLRVAVRAPASQSASVQWLLAPSVRATRGISIAGQHLDGNGQWIGRRVTDLVTSTRLGYRLRLPAHSAALLTVPLGRRAASNGVGVA